MKKSLILGLFLAVLLLAVFVSAADVQEDLTESRGQIKNLSTSLNSKVNSLLTNEKPIPGYLKAVAVLFFGFKDKDLKLEQIVIVICSWLMLLMIITSLMEFVPIFQQNGVRIAAGIAICLLAGLSGGLNQIYTTLFDMSSIFGFLGKYTILRMLFSLIFLIAFAYVVKFFLKKIKDKSEIEEAKGIGEQLAQGQIAANIQYKGMKKLAGQK